MNSCDVAKRTALADLYQYGSIRKVSHRHPRFKKNVRTRLRVEHAFVVRIVRCAKLLPQ